jgi:hypothetical protein
MLSFYGTSISMSEMPVPRRADDLWAMLNDESPKNVDFMLVQPAFLQVFNITSTYSRSSHLPIPTQWLLSALN